MYRCCVGSDWLAVFQISKYNLDSLLQPVLSFIFFPSPSVFCFVLGTITTVARCYFTRQEEEELEEVRRGRHAPFLGQGPFESVPVRRTFKSTKRPEPRETLRTPRLPRATWEGCRRSTGYSAAPLMSAP